MEGWDGLRESDNRHLLDKKISQDDLDLAFVRCFSNEAGQEVLEYLKGTTLDQPS